MKKELLAIVIIALLSIPLAVGQQAGDEQTDQLLQDLEGNLNVKENDDYQYPQPRYTQQTSGVVDNDIDETGPTGGTSFCRIFAWGMYELRNNALRLKGSRINAIYLYDGQEHSVWLRCYYTFHFYNGDVDTVQASPFIYSWGGYHFPQRAYRKLWVTDPVRDPVLQLDILVTGQIDSEPFTYEKTFYDMPFSVEPYELY